MDAVAAFYRDYVHDCITAAQSLDLTHIQAKALALALERPRTMRELAELLSCDASNATLIVDRLERRGLVERHTNPADRRAKHVTATPEGSALAQQVRDRMHATRTALDTLDPAQRRALHNLLQHLHTTASESTTDL